MYATGNVSPFLDTSQDLTVLEGYRNDTHTAVRFRKPWRSCDISHDRNISVSYFFLVFLMDNQVACIH